MEYDFDTIVSRRGTDCEKWDLPAEDGVLPLWVADMDFRAAPAIVDTLRRRVDEGVFGYALPPAAWHESLARWLARRHGWRVDPDSVLNAISVLPALAAVIRVFCQPGDKVVLQTPAYNGFLSVIRNQGCEISGNPLPGGQVPFHTIGPASGRDGIKIDAHVSPHFQTPMGPTLMTDVMSVLTRWILCHIRGGWGQPPSLIMPL